LSASASRTRLVEGLEEVQGVTGVLQGLQVVFPVLPGPREDVVGMGLLEGVGVVLGQGEGLVQVTDGLVVPAQHGVGTAEEPVRECADRGSGRWAAAATAACHTARSS
jgi:hypothetical protein